MTNVEPWPRDRFNPLKFTLLFWTLSLILNWTHELFHLGTTILFGGQAHVVASLLVFATDITVWPTQTWTHPIIVYSGGWGIAILTWWLWSQTIDEEWRITLHAIGWAQFFYGTVEGTTWILNRYDLVQWVGALAMITGTIYALSKSKKMWTLNDPENT